MESFLTMFLIGLSLNIKTDLRSVHVYRTDCVAGLAVQGCGLHPVHRRVPEQLQHRADRPGQIQIHPPPPGNHPMSVAPVSRIDPPCPGQTDDHQPGAHHDLRLPAGLTRPLQPPRAGHKTRGQAQSVQ